MIEKIEKALKKKLSQHGVLSKVEQIGIFKDNIGEERIHFKVEFNNEELEVSVTLEPYSIMNYKEMYPVNYKTVGHPKWYLRDVKELNELVFDSKYENYNDFVKSRFK